MISPRLESKDYQMMIISIGGVKVLESKDYQVGDDLS